MAASSFRSWFLGWLARVKSIHRCSRGIYRFLRFTLPRLLLSIIPAPRHLGFYKGSFSGLELLKNRRVEGRLVFEHQYCSPFPPGSLVRLSNLGQDGYQPWPGFWIKLNNISLTGSSLVARNAEGLLLGEATFPANGGLLDLDDPACNHWARKPSQTISGNATSIVSRWGREGYWHWLMDSVSRLAFLDEFPQDTKIIVRPLTAWRKWFIIRLGIESRCIETESKDIAVENYYFSSPTSMTGCYNPHAVHFLRSRFLKYSSNRTDLPKRFYIIREGFTRGIQNEQEVREFFTRKGWALIAPEKLAIEDQIALFSGAEAIAGIHGSAFTNLIWCQPGCNILELNAENFLLGAFEVVAKTLDLHHSFLICPADSHSHAFVNVSKLDAAISKIFTL